jgi:hypothetical protein
LGLFLLPFVFQIKFLLYFRKLFKSKVFDHRTTALLGVQLQVKQYIMMNIHPERAEHQAGASVTVSIEESHTHDGVNDDRGVDNKDQKATKEQATTTTTLESEKQHDDQPDQGCAKRFWELYWENEFIILVILAILLAKAYPPLGGEYLQPDITSTWIAVVFIFCTFAIRTSCLLLYSGLYFGCLVRHYLLI